MSLKSGLASFFLLKFGSLSSSTSTSTAVRRCNFGHLRPVPPSKRAFTCLATSSPQTAEKSDGELLVVVGGGAAGVYGAIRAKSLAPHLNVLVVEKGKLLSKVKISGGGRCNVTNGHCPDTKILAEHYPRGHRELKGSFFNTHGPGDTMSWFTDHGVALKIEEDGRVFPITNNSSSIVDCLLSEARERGVPVSVCLQTGKTVTSVSAGVQGKFILKVEKRSVEFLEYLEADYLLIASGGSRQGYDLAVQLGHSIVDGVPSLFTFKIKDPLLSELSGLGPMLVTHWGLSGPVILRLSAWGARDLFRAGYKALLMVDVVPDLNIEDMKAILSQQKQKFSGLNCDTLWASVSNNSINSVAYLLKHCTFEVVGKGQYKDEFVTAGGVPLSEVLNVDGVTGGFNFQNAWSGGYIAGTTIGELAAKAVC
ncbi:unnamed protein product [Linum tenue]|uniref:FAD/NAD(P)-binding oxidoreductase family protein n=1 Tax=Linum tenue TaxID=586396 RepID=A0AAV0N570_9ROSI|nr:unnamed protein product [Linum tenue]